MCGVDRGRVRFLKGKLAFYYMEYKVYGTRDDLETARTQFVQNFLNDVLSEYLREVPSEPISAELLNDGEFGSGRVVIGSIEEDLAKGAHYFVVKGPLDEQHYGVEHARELLGACSHYYDRCEGLDGLGR